jgi:hypothetical protein
MSNVLYEFITRGREGGCGLWYSPESLFYTETLLERDILMASFFPVRHACAHCVPEITVPYFQRRFLHTLRSRFSPDSVMAIARLGRGYFEKSGIMYKFGIPMI